MALSNPVSTASPDMIIDWCQTGFIRFQLTPNKVAQEARSRLYEHLHSLVKINGSLPKVLCNTHEIQSALATIAKRSTKEHRDNPRDFLHLYPLQSFILLNRELAKLPDDLNNGSMNSINAVKKAFAAYKKLYVIEEEEGERTLLVRKTSPTERHHEMRITSPVHLVPNSSSTHTSNISDRNSYRGCSWAKRACQRLKSLFCTTSLGSKDEQTQPL